jgi:hypothetical protein
VTSSRLHFSSPSKRGQRPSHGSLRLRRCDVRWVGGSEEDIQLQWRKGLSPPRSGDGILSYGSSLLHLPPQILICSMVRCPDFSISATTSLFTNRNYRIHGHPAYRLTPKQSKSLVGTPRSLVAYNLMRRTVYAGLMCLPTREIWPSLPMIRMRRAARGFIGLRGISRRICKPLARACRRTTRPPIRLNKA